VLVVAHFVFSGVSIVLFVLMHAPLLLPIAVLCSPSACCASSILLERLVSKVSVASLALLSALSQCTR
jgi:hypothetical protein